MDVSPLTDPTADRLDIFDFAEYRTLLRIYYPRILENESERKRTSEAISEIEQKAKQRRKTNRQLTRTEKRFIELLHLLIQQFEQQQNTSKP